MLYIFSDNERVYMDNNKIIRILIVLASFILSLGVFLVGWSYLHIISYAPSIRNTRVPDMQGMNERQVKDILLDKGLNYNSAMSFDAYAPAGYVIRQNPEPQTLVPVGYRIGLLFNRGMMTPKAMQSTPIRLTFPEAFHESAPIQSEAFHSSPSTPIVCDDPGHPSETSSGAFSQGLSEMLLNWQVAVLLKALLERHGIYCILIKSKEDQYVTNRERAEIANRENAILFVRLHCDDGSGSGYTWYYPNCSATKDKVTAPSLIVPEGSREVATILNNAMAPILRGFLQSNPVRTDAFTAVGSKQVGVLTGSIFAKVPTALIEMCFINQKHDVNFIASKKGQLLMANAIASGIVMYVMHRDGR